MESLLEYQQWAKTALDYSLIPNQKMVAGIKRYVEHGVFPGGFIAALLSNNLTEAMSGADSTNRKFLVWATDEHGNEFPPAWVKWLIWDVPGDLCGSYAKVALHCKKMTTDATGVCCTEVSEALMKGSVKH